MANQQNNTVLPYSKKYQFHVIYFIFMYVLFIYLVYTMSMINPFPWWQLFVRKSAKF